MHGTDTRQYRALSRMGALLQSLHERYSGNTSGDWARRVGLPAKSGVGGGVLAVVNRQLGIGVFSPRLDAAGNSVRGLSVCVGLAEEMGLHAFDSTNQGSAVLNALSLPR